MPTGAGGICIEDCGTFTQAASVMWPLKLRSAGVAEIDVIGRAVELQRGARLPGDPGGAIHQGSVVAVAVAVAVGVGGGLAGAPLSV